MTPAFKLKLAREAAAKACAEPQRASILEGLFDRTPGVQSALLAIDMAFEEAANCAVSALEKLDEPTQALIVGDAIRKLKDAQ